MRDLVYISEGGKGLAKHEISARTSKAVYAIVLEVKKYQDIGYKYQEIQGFAYFIKHLPFMNMEEQELDQLSMELEPRGAPRSDIV